MQPPGSSPHQNHRNHPVHKMHQHMPWAHTGSSVEPAGLVLVIVATLWRDSTGSAPQFRIKESRKSPVTQCDPKNCSVISPPCRKIPGLHRSCAGGLRSWRLHCQSYRSCFLLKRDSSSDFVAQPSTSGRSASLKLTDLER